MPEIKNIKDVPFAEDTAAVKSATLVGTAEMAETADNLISGSKLNGDEGLNGRKGRNGHLTSGRLLARNTIWNLVGSGAPMLVAVFCLPSLIRGWGADRFGVLPLAGAPIGKAIMFGV